MRQRCPGRQLCSGYIFKKTLFAFLCPPVFGVSSEMPGKLCFSLTTRLMTHILIMGYSVIQDSLENIPEQVPIYINRDRFQEKKNKKKQMLISV